MKKAAFILILCLATTATFAQKKGKSDRGNDKNGDAIEYLVVRCIEQSPMTMEMENMSKEEMAIPEVQQKMAMMKFQEVTYRFNVLGNPRDFGAELGERIEGSESPSEALSAAGSEGWELESAVAISEHGVTVHYYYLAREQ